MPDTWEGREYEAIDEDSAIWIVVISRNFGVVLVAGFFWDCFWEQTDPLQLHKRLCQQSHGLTITETVGALQGTILQDHNFGGSHICVNTTFSACRSSFPTFPDLTVIPELSRFFSEARKHKLTSFDFVRQTVDRHTFWSQIESYMEKPERYVFPTPFTPITFTDCTFTDLKDETDNSDHSSGGALHLFTPSPLLVKGCTFTNCQASKGNGGAIFVSSDRAHNPEQIRVESSTFKDCSSLSGYGGGICVRPSVKLELVSCTFENGSALSGGAVYAVNCAVSLSTFKDNKAQTGGGIACNNDLTIHFCYFEGNQATSDPDFTWWLANCVFTLFGIAYSDSHWTAQSDILFVRTDGTDTATCSLAEPCSLLSTAVSLAPSDGSVEVQVGTGSFGSATLSGTQELTLNGLFAETDLQMTPPTTSFSIEVKDESSLTIDTFTLSPLKGEPLVTIPSGSTGAQVNMTHLRLSGSGITTVPFDFRAGTVTLQYSCFESLSDIQCSLISAAGSANLTISWSYFMDIEIEASVIDVVDGVLDVLNTHFTRITRTEGTGSAAIDARNPQHLTIYSSFCHCHSVEGVAGALHITNSEDTDSVYLEVLLIGNKGKDNQTAHDVFLSGVTLENLPSCSFISCSDQPRIISENEIKISSLRIDDLAIVEDEVIADLVVPALSIISVRTLESTDLSMFMDRNYLRIVFSTSPQRVVAFSPLHVHSGRVQIETKDSKVRPILTQSNKTEETLFKLTSENGDGTIFVIQYVRILLNTQHIAPMITVDAQSSFQLRESVVSSDGGLSRRPFMRSEGHLDFSQVLFIDMSYDGCSCIETTGGKVKFYGDSTMETKGVYSLSTNVDGAFLHAVRTNVVCSLLAWVDCHAKNGGAIFTKDCFPVDISGSFIDCSAEERGGGFCSEHSNSISQSTNFSSMSSFANCHAKFGGGFFLEIAPMMNVSIQEHYYQLSFFGQELSLCLFEGCSAEKGAGGYLDGEIGLSTQHYITTSSSINDGPLCQGSEFFISQSLAESILRKGDLPSDYFDHDGSLSSRSESDNGPFKHVEVEGYPQHSFNFELPNIVVYYYHELYLFGCLDETFTDSCSSLSHIIDRFHTQTDNGRFLQVPIKLKDTLFIFETARVTKQSIKLILTDEGYPPPERTAIAFGNNHKSDTTVFIVVDTSGSVELSELKVDRDEDLTLCQLVDRTASLSILGSEISIASALSFPLIECEAGTLVISDSSFSSTTSDTFNHPLVLSGMSASFTSNSTQSEMIIEMSGVEFTDLTMGDEVGVVELNDTDHIKLSQIVFQNVKLSNDSEAVRIVVRGRDLWKTIERVPNSGFAQRGIAEIDILYQSLDRNEEGTRFHTPTLLFYLTNYRAPTIHVQSDGRDVSSCGDTILSCFSLDEADRHLEEGFPSVITVIDSAQLTTQLDLVQDKTKISAKGSTCLIEVGADGSLINHKTGSVDHILELVHLSFVLSSGRSTALLQSTSGTLIVTACSFSCSSELESELVLITGGILRVKEMSVTDLEMTDCALIESKGNVEVSDSTFERIVGNIKGTVELTLTETATAVITKSTFKNCESAADGGAVAVTLRDSASLEIRTTSFHSCSSGGNGGAVWIDASSSPASFTFSLLKLDFGRGSESNQCGTSKRGSDVFILGGNLQTLVDASKWEGTFETAQRWTLCGWDEEKGRVIDILSLFRSGVLMVSGNGDDEEGIGSAASPFRTVWNALRAAEESEEEEGWVEVLDSVRIGKKVEIVGEEGREKKTTLSGSAEDSKIICFLETTKQHDQLKREEGMIVLTRHSLNIDSITIVLTPTPLPVIVVKKKAQVSLSECKVIGDETTHSMLVVVHSDGVVKVLWMMSERMKMGGKGSIAIVRGGAMEMEDSSFSGLETQGGGVVWGQTSERITLVNSNFTNCRGEEFGSVVRVTATDCKVIISKCRFVECWTGVGMKTRDTGRREGGGTVLIDLRERKRGGPCSVDLSMSIFTNCVLENTDSSVDEGRCVGGSGFLVLGNGPRQRLDLSGMTMSDCSCRNVKMADGFDGGVIGWRTQPPHTDRRGLIVKNCKLGAMMLAN